jgi:hypothetical protein
MAPLALVCPNPKAPLALERAFDFGQKNAACPAPGSGQTPNAQQAVRRRTCLARAGLLSDSDSDIVVVVAGAAWLALRERKSADLAKRDGRDATPHTTLGLAHRA